MNDYVVKPGKSIQLKDFNPDDRGDWTDKKELGLEKLVELRQKLDHLQDVLYAEHKNKILIVIQAMDTAGKDGTIRTVFEGINPAGVRVVSFKVPSAAELDHDYLWRIHSQVPGKGELVIFNRSHYEDVLVVRVHKLVPEAEWKRRYEQINAFEKMLADQGTTIVKFFLNITQDEQKRRLLDRLEIPEKNWKFSAADLEERKLWPDYMQAYEDALNRTSTDWAPWHIIPANHNWYRNLVVASVIVNSLEGLKMSYPPPGSNLDLYRQQLEKGDLH